MNNTYYGFTIKNIQHNAEASEKDLSNIMCKLILRHKGLYVDHFFEKDSIGRLHIHGTFMAKRNILKTLFKQQYIHIHIDLLKETADVENWARYIRKCQ